MKKEKDKFGNFVHEQRKKEEEILNICQDIMKNSRNELAVSMHFLYGALSALTVVPSRQNRKYGNRRKTSLRESSVVNKSVYGIQSSY